MPASRSARPSGPTPILLGKKQSRPSWARPRESMRPQTSELQQGANSDDRATKRRPVGPEMGPAHHTPLVSGHCAWLGKTSLRSKSSARAIVTDYTKAGRCRSVISQEQRTRVAENNVCPFKALQGLMIEGPFYNQLDTRTPPPQVRFLEREREPWRRKQLRVSFRVISPINSLCI